MPYIDRAFIGGLSFLRTAIFLTGGLLMADGAPSAVNKLACYWFLLILAFRSMLAEMRYRERNRGHQWTHLHYQFEHQIEHQIHFVLTEITLSISLLMH